MVRHSLCNELIGLRKKSDTPACPFLPSKVLDDFIVIGEEARIEVRILGDFAPERRFAPLQSMAKIHKGGKPLLRIPDKALVKGVAINERTVKVDSQREIRRERSCVDGVTSG